MRNIKALLIDLSGTLHVGSEPIKGAVAAIQKLRQAKVPFRFCSNTSKESSAALIHRLNNAGFEVHPEELFTSLGAMKKLLHERGVQRPYLLLSPSAEEDFADFAENSGSNEGREEKGYDAVVIGLAPTKFSYEHLNEAFRILSNTTSGSKPIPLLATHRARYVRSPSGQLSLGPGPFVSALETGVGNGLRGESVGKPDRAFFEVCLKDLGVSLDGFGRSQLKIEDVAVVGDDVEADLAGGAIELGLRRILVKTGKYRDGDERKMEIPPDAVFESIGDLVDILLSENLQE
ncbi:hypothetical protein FRC19_004595 [Serendipita sp. 401]|nr:hypothetical protein FRC16_011472 [Serendipita sp. 398]KAG8823117.1 hypothetical protein FRC19_004595 [Serendipita sp. 401]KAG9052669.1 hypothetical protein FS842_009439 [Serendipita sp. 407]